MPKINQTEQQLMLKTLLEIPPEALKDYCDRQLIKEHWFDCKLFFELLNESLTNYFSGQQWKAIDIHKRLYELVELWRNYYVRLYDLIYNCWQPIKGKLNRLGVSFDSPGQLVSEILRIHSYEFFVRVLPEFTTGNLYKEFSPRKYNKLVRKYQKLKQKETLKIAEQKQLQILEKTRKNELEEVKIMNAIVGLIVNIASSQPKKNCLVHDSLSSFVRANQMLSKFRLKATHPREKLQGWAISKERMKKSDRRGGIFC